MAEQKQEKKRAKVSINLDNTPILYTENIGITINQDGVVLDVMQRLGNTETIRVVSRIGMSRQHAAKFNQELGKLLAVTQTSDDQNRKKN